MVEVKEKPRSVVVLGATGSVGLAALDVIQQFPERFKVYGLAAKENDQRLLAQCRVYCPRFVYMDDIGAAERLRNSLRELGSQTQVLTTPEQLDELVSDPEVATVVSAIVGAAGLRPTLAAVKAGKRVLLANKEALVVAGKLVMREVAKSGALILPIDSEHNAMYQCAPTGVRCGQGAGEFLRTAGVERLFLMASGGPFRQFSNEALKNVTVEQALNHPVWRMGPKISIDSATLMNKGLELIEAGWLFDLSVSQIQVVVHPEAVIHGMVEFADGSVIAQMAVADMRVPLAYGLHWPERKASGCEPLDVFRLSSLNFEEPDLVRFPALRLAREAMCAGGAAPAILNAANEAAVAAFLAGRIGFLDITAVVDLALQTLPVDAVEELEALMAVDVAARAFVERSIEQHVDV